MSESNMTIGVKVTIFVLFLSATLLILSFSYGIYLVASTQDKLTGSILICAGSVVILPVVCIGILVVSKQISTCIFKNENIQEPNIV